MRTYKKCFITSNKLTQHYHCYKTSHHPLVLFFKVMIENRKIVLFDGVCNLCNSSVQFILKRDTKNQFLFGSLQGENGQAYLRKFNLPPDTLNSFMLVEAGVLYTKSTGRTAHAEAYWGCMVFAVCIYYYSKVYPGCGVFADCQQPLQMVWQAGNLLAACARAEGKVPGMS